MTVAEKTNFDAIQSGLKGHSSVCAIITTYEPADNLGSLVSAATTARSTTEARR